MPKMADWTKPMQQTYEYYIVNPDTWKETKLLQNISSCIINRDLDSDTLGSATIDAVDSLGEAYVRAYLITVQDGITEKHPLDTFLVQTPSSSFDGKLRDTTMDAYTPLLELKENHPPFGYSLLKNDNIMEKVYMLTRDSVRAPVIQTTIDKQLTYDFVANGDDTWLTFLKDLMATVDYSFSLDELGRIQFAPKQDLKSLQPVWTYTDDNSSILYPEVMLNHDLYGIPNVVEVIYSNNAGHFYATATNSDPNSPTSTVARGRKITQRITNPTLFGVPTQEQLDLFAINILRQLSSVEYSISYTHGYCPVRIGDCVSFNYEGAGLKNIKGKVISQSITCESGTPVSEKAIFTTNLWG